MSKLAPQTKNELRKRRHARIRAKVVGTSARPRLSVFRSNKFLYVQLIDDASGRTLLSASSQEQKGKGMVANAKTMGTKLAKAAAEKGITSIVFDRGGFTYTGVIKSLADAAREGGLSF